MRTQGKNHKLYDSVGTINVQIKHIFIEILTTLFQGQITEHYYISET